MSRAILALFLLTSFIACNLEMLDNPFREGTGSVTGTVTFKGLPIEGAQVNWVGQPHEILPIETGPDGTFTINGLPAGEIEIILRSESQYASLRTSVSVVADRTSVLEDLNLKETPSLSVALLDPDLPVPYATVHLREIPGLEATTDINGHVWIPAVPPEGCYTPVVVHVYFKFPESTVCRERWEDGLAIEPDYNLRFLVHNAYRLHDELQARVSGCDPNCVMPKSAIWNWDGPPCAWPTQELREDDNDFFQWQSNADTMSRLDRFTSGIYASIMTCPSTEVLKAECDSSDELDKCQIQESVPADSVEWERLHWGTSRIDDCDGLQRVPADQFEIGDLARCLGLDGLEPLGSDSRYVLVEFGTWVERPRLLAANESAEQWRLYAIAEMPPSSESAFSEGENDVDPDFSWSLYKLNFPLGDVPSPDEISVHLSWIIPL